jgi:hypothetical protein
MPGCDMVAQQNRTFPSDDKRARDDDRSSRKDKSAVAYAGVPAKVVAGQKFAWAQINLSAFRARISCERVFDSAFVPTGRGVQQQLGGILPEELLLVGLRKNERTRSASVAIVRPSFMTIGSAWCRGRRQGDRALAWHGLNLQVYAGTHGDSASPLSSRRRPRR